MSEGSIPVQDRAQRNSVEIFLTALEKSIRSARVYAYESGQKMLDNIYENVVNALDRAFHEEEIIDIQIKPVQMFFQKKLVYENKDKKQSLALALYQNGIRVLSLKRGLSKDELIRIIEILATDFSKPEMMDQDLYCMFTENPLDHFEVVGADILAEAQKEDEDLKKNLQIFRTKISNKKRDPVPQKARRLRADDLKVIEEFQLNSSQFQRSDEEVSKIVSTIGQLSSKKEKETLERLALMGFHFLLQETDVEQNQVGRELVSQVGLMMLDEGYVDLFSALVGKVFQLQQDHPIQRGEYQKILDSIFHVDNYSLFRKNLISKEYQKKIAETLLHAPGGAVRLVIRLLHVQPWCAKVFGDYVLRHSVAHSDWLSEEVQRRPDDNCWEHLLNILAQRPNQQLSKFLNSLLSSAAETLRLKVLRQCAQIGTEETLAVFGSMMASKEYEDRKLAYELLSLARNKAALKLIKDQIDSKGFAAFDDQEKQLLYASLMQIGADAAYSWFESQWMAPGQGLFKSKSQNERRLQLLKAASQSAPTFVSRILEKTPSQSLSQEIQEVIQKVSK